MSASTLNAGSPLMIELFAGSARMAQTFREAGFETFTVDIEELSRDPERQIDLIADVLSLKADDLPPNPYVVWASPPCREFSRAYNAPQAVAERQGRSYTPMGGLSLIQRAILMIEQLQPKYWVIENVAGARKWLKPILGEPRQVIGPYCLWGNFPHICIDPSTQFQPKNLKAGGHDRHSVQKRSVIPIEISRGLRRAMLEQTTLERWI